MGANTLHGFKAGFEAEHGRKPTEQDIWNAAVTSGIKRTIEVTGPPDSARLDWLEKSTRSFCGNYSGSGFRMIGSSIWHGTLREAIDGAMLAAPTRKPELAKQKAWCSIKSAFICNTPKNCHESGQCAKANDA